jgi:hypothetical protein
MNIPPGVGREYEADAAGTLFSVGYWTMNFIAVLKTFCLPM